LSRGKSSLNTTVVEGRAGVVRANLAAVWIDVEGGEQVGGAGPGAVENALLR
jgi:hypothetical protein